MPARSAREISAGVVPGCPTGGFAAILALHPRLHALATSFSRDKPFRIWAEFDDITLGGPKSIVFEIVAALQNILLSTLRLTLDSVMCYLCAPITFGG